MPNDTGFVPHARADIVELALAGLTASPKTLPAMLFYDDEGCRLFYEITRLPEYYLTRTETALLPSIAAGLCRMDSAMPCWSNSAAAMKPRHAFCWIFPNSPFNTYVSIDVAAHP